MILQFEHQNWFWFLVCILVVWRLTTLICYEAGPFNLMTKCRIILYNIKLGSILDCFHCTAMWVAMITTLLVYQIQASSILILLGIAGGASILEKFLQHESNTETNE